MQSLFVWIIMCFPLHTSILCTICLMKWLCFHHSYFSCACGTTVPFIFSEHTSLDHAKYSFRVLLWYFLFKLWCDSILSLMMLKIFKILCLPIVFFLILQSLQCLIPTIHGDDQVIHRFHGNKSCIWCLPKEKRSS